MKRVLTDDAFPSVSEWVANQDDVVERGVVKIPEMQTIGVSIYIPPESLPGAGAYDLRFLMLSRFPPSTEKLLVRDTGRAFQQSMTLYYGSVDFDKSAVGELESAELIHSSRSSRILATSPPGFTTLLHPTDEVYNVGEIDYPLNHTQLGQVFSYSSKAELIGETIQSSSLEEEESVIMVLDGATPLEKPIGLITPPEAPMDRVNSKEKLVIQFPLTIELSDNEVHPIRFIKMAQPFQDMRGRPYHTKNEVSNTIFVRSDAE